MEPAVKLVGEKEASGKLAAIYASLKKELGFVPNTFRAMGHTPDFIQALLRLDQASAPSIPEKYKQLICLAVSAANGCTYCVYAHSAIAKKAGATDQEIGEALAVAAMMSAFNTFNKALGMEPDIKP